MTPPILTPTAAHRHTGATAAADTAVQIRDQTLGREGFGVIAGPCAVESREQLLATAHACQRAGAVALRGGAFKPRTSPTSFQGLGRAGLALLAEARADTGLPIVTELIDVRQLEAVVAVADIVQIGARNMHNYPLLTEVGRAGVPCLLKRGLAATIDELLLAAEYIMREGNDAVILCERGIRTFERAYRFTLDVAAIPVIKERTRLPVIVDPSHAAGRRELVPALAMAAAAAGADGIIVETHVAPEEALCDGDQAIPAWELPSFVSRVRTVASAARHAVGDRLNTLEEAPHAALA